VRPVWRPPAQPTSSSHSRESSVTNGARLSTGWSPAPNAVKSVRSDQ
jgi:hypothetical protein